MGKFAVNFVRKTTDEPKKCQRKNSLKKSESILWMEIFGSQQLASMPVPHTFAQWDKWVRQANAKINVGNPNDSRYD